MRLKAYNALGIKDVWVSVVEPKDENQKLEYALSDNDRAGYYDDDMLANLIPNYDIDWSQYAVDMKPPEDIQKLIDRIAPVEEDEAPEVSEGEAVSKLGEVYQLGRHRLMCGDSTKIEDVEKLMDGKKADMVFTDPPYNIGYDYQSWDDNFKRDEYKKWCMDWFNLLKTFSKGNIVMTIGTMNIAMWYEIEPPLAMGVWIKNNGHSGGKISKLSKWEPLMFYGNYKGMRRDSDIFDYYVNSGFLRNKEEASTMEEHSCNKPIRLLGDIIKSYSKGDEVWLDIFGGSGSTLIACEQTNRICYMSELDPRYVDVIRKRYAKFIGKEETWQTV